MRNIVFSLFVTLLCLGISPIHAGAIYEPYTVTTFAGWNDVRSQDAVGKLARFYRPYGVISDSAGNLSSPMRATPRSGKSLPMGW